MYVGVGVWLVEAWARACACDPPSRFFNRVSRRINQPIRENVSSRAHQVSALYAGADPPTHMVRFCFCKHDAKLDAACDALARYFGRAA